MTQGFQLTNERPLIYEEPGAASWKDAHVLPSQYFDPAVLEREKSEFRRNWIIVGAKANVPNPGDFMTVSLFEHSILICNVEGEIKGFHNVCLHRCRRLVDDCSGSAKTFRCVYHGWTYGIDGRLRGVPNRDSFPGLQIENEALSSVRLGVWNGLIFANLDGKAESLEDFMSPLTPVVDGWYRDVSLISDETHRLRGNWKIQVGNFTEFYHLLHLHAQRKGTSMPERSGFVLFKKHSMQVLPMIEQRAWAENPPADWTTWTQVERRKDAGFGFHLFIYPCTTVHINPFYGVVTYIQTLPDGQDPQTSYLRVRRFRLPDGDPSFARMHSQVGQDIENSAPHAAGLRAAGDRPQRFSLLECRVAHFHATLGSRIAML